MTESGDNHSLGDELQCSAWGEGVDGALKSDAFRLAQEHPAGGTSHTGVQTFYSRQQLADEISLLCKRSLQFECSAEVRGLLGIVIDEKHIMWVDIKETFEVPRVAQTSHIKAEPSEENVENSTSQDTVFNPSCVIKSEYTEKNEIDLAESIQTVNQHVDNVVSSNVKAEVKSEVKTEVKQEAVDHQCDNANVLCDDCRAEEAIGSNVEHSSMSGAASMLGADEHSLPGTRQLTGLSTVNAYHSSEDAMLTNVPACSGDPSVSSAVHVAKDHSAQGVQPAMTVDDSVFDTAQHSEGVGSLWPANVTALGPAALGSAKELNAVSHSGYLTHVSIK
jgi:hypothetical protein